MNDGLPPLPEFPVGTMTVTYGVDRKVKVPVFSEHQLREYTKQAVEAEREACAQLAIKKLWAGEVVANAIRARGNA
jgi:hypothetical protein